MVMFESKNEILYKAKDALQDVEPSTLTEFGQNVSDNLTILGNRISSIMSGSSDDSWDDKVKTQITSAIEKIGTSVKEEQKTAEVVKGAYSILSKLKEALGEYVLGYEDFYAHIQSESKITKEEIVEIDGKKVTQKTQEYKDWLKKDEILRKTVRELEEQAETWMKQMKTYFEAYNFETHELDTAIYTENKDPLKYYNDLYKQYESEYEKEKENVVPAETETPPVEETTDLGTTGKKKDTSGSKITDNGDGTYTVIVVDAETGKETKFTIDYDPSTEEGKEKLKEKLKEECGDTFDEETLEQLGDTLGNSSKDEQRTPREVADEVVQQMKDDGCGDYLLSGEGLEELWKRLKDKGLSDEEISQVICDYMREDNVSEEEITQTIESLNERLGTKDETSDTVADEKTSTYELESGTTVVDNGDGTYEITIRDSESSDSKTFTIDYDPTTPEGQEKLKGALRLEGSSFLSIGDEETICDEIVTVVGKEKEDIVTAASDVEDEESKTVAPPADDEKEVYLYSWDDPANAGKKYTEAEVRHEIGSNGAADEIIAQLKAKGIIVDDETTKVSEGLDESEQTPVEESMTVAQPTVDTSGKTIPDCLKFGMDATGTLADTPVDYEFTLMQNGYSQEEAQAEVAALRENGLITGQTAVHGQVVSQPETPVEGAVAVAQPPVDTSGKTIPDCLKNATMITGNNTIPDAPAIYEHVLMQHGYSKEEAQAEIEALRENGLIASPTVVNGQVVSQPETPVEGAVAVAQPPVDTSGKTIPDCLKNATMITGNNTIPDAPAIYEHVLMQHGYSKEEAQAEIEALRENGLIASPTVVNGQVVSQPETPVEGADAVAQPADDEEEVYLYSWYDPANAGKKYTEEEARREIGSNGAADEIIAQLKADGIIVDGETTKVSEGLKEPEQTPVVSQPETPIIPADDVVQTAVNDVISGMTAEGMGEYILSGEGLELFWDRMAAKGVGVDDISGAVADLMRQDHCTDNEITTTLNSLQTRYERMTKGH